MPIDDDPIHKLERENQTLRAELDILKSQKIAFSQGGLFPAKLHAILEEIPIAIAWSGSKGLVEFVNRKFCDLFGYELSEIQTVEGWFRLAYPDPEYRATLLTRWKESLKRFKTYGETIPDTEVSITCKNGAVRTMNVRIVIIGGTALAIFDDLTESNKARKALLESESLFRAVFNEAKNGMLVADASTGQFYLANKAMVEMLGYTKEEIGALHVSDIHPADALEEVQTFFKRQIRGETITAPGLPVKRKDGAIFFADISSGPLIMNGRQCLLGVFHDISERKKYEEVLLSERNFSNALLNSLPGIFYMFDQEGRFLRWNRNFTTVSGYSEEELKRILALDLFDGEEKGYIKEKIEEAFKKGTAETEAHFMHKNGKKTPYYLTGLLSHIDDVPCLVGVGIDISQRKQGEKMQALGQLAGGIAHDFNNQLSAILGFSEMLVNQTKDETLKHYAKMIGRAATRSANLTRQLLAFAHKGKYQIEPVDIHRVIEEVVDILKRSIDKRIIIRQILAANPSTTLGDPDQIMNAFLNLAINGRDAMPDGGELTFKTSHMLMNDACLREAGLDIAPGPYLKIDVTDTGHGMGEEVLRHIYEPFFTTKKIGAGAGMGLPAVYGTVKNHKGAISVKTKPGQGATFSIFLPLSQEAPLSEKPLSSPTLSPANDLKARILVVDDESMVRALSKDILSLKGHEVLLSRDGKEALTLYEKAWESIHLVILDLMMPNMSGSETYMALKKINPSVKVLLSSGYSLDGEAHSLLRQGAIDFIQKPFSVKTLTEKVYDALNR
jgi:PAS domain S-box-containing protein